MSRTWMTRLTANRSATSALALTLAIALVDVGVVVARSGGSNEGHVRQVVAGPGTTLPSGAPETSGVGGTSAATTVVGGASGPAGVRNGGGVGGTGSGAVSLPPGELPTTPGSAPCTPAKGYRATGIDEHQVTVGQIVTDNSAIPAALYPNHEGLLAYFDLVNAAGGVCGRKLNILYSNDNANPATHDYPSMVHKVFAFVANSSLIEQIDYQSDKPFDPLFSDNGEFVPDIGSLAFTYARAQSPVYFGAVGSLSPSLTGGLQFKYLVDDARARGKPCRKAGMVYLREPTGASEDGGRLAGIALENTAWGAGLGAGNVKYYVQNLADPEPVYEQTIAQMAADGVNCAFAYLDLTSTVTFVQAAVRRGVWPPDKCTGPTCFSLLFVPVGSYDPKFIRDAGDGSRFVTTFILSRPLNETSNPAMHTYLQALAGVPKAEPGAFSVQGYAAGMLFVRALAACGSAPTRSCLLSYLRGVHDFDADGLLGPVPLDRRTRVICNGDCGSFKGRGTYDWKWIAPCTVALQILDRDNKRDFYRINPGSDFACDTLHVARGTPG